MFSESCLWECRVFTVSADKCVTFSCIFTGFAENRLWECRIFSFTNTRTSQKSRVFPFTCHLFLLLEALQGFARLLEVLEVFGMVWKVLEGFAGFEGFCEAMGSFERRGEALGGSIDFGWALSCFGRLGFGRLWEAFEKPWGALGGCGLSIVCPSPRLWEALGSFGSLWGVSCSCSLSLCKAL